MVTSARAGITSCQLRAEGLPTSVRIKRKFFAPIVGPDVEILAVMRSVILDALPRGSITRKSLRPVARFQIAQFRCKRARQFDEQESRGCAFFPAQREAPVVFLIDQRV